MQTSLAKKLFAVGASGAMLLAFAPALTAFAQVHAAGTNVLSNGTVYFINASGQKQPYTSAGAFLSYGFNSWSNVVAASAEDLALPTGSFVPPADGSLINDGGTVYVITNGQREGFANPQAFLGMGYTWSEVIPGDTSFLTSLAPINSASQAHLPGTLINQSNTIYLISSNGKLGIPTPSVFESWGYSWNNVVLANSYDDALPSLSTVMPTMMMGYLNPLAQLNSTGVTNPTNPTTPTSGTGSVNVSLSSTNPAAGSVAKGAEVELADYTLAAGSGGATINTFVANRIGLSSDSDVTNLYLYNDSTGLLLGYGSFNQGVVTFSGNPLLTLSGNQSVNVSLWADISTTATVGDSIGYSVMTSAAVPGVTTTGSFPISGNLFTIAGVTNLGSLVVTSPSTVATTQNPGQTQATVGYFQFQGSNQPLSISNINFTVVGSTASTDLQNFTLWNGSSQVGASVQENSSDVVDFNLSGAPMLLPSGTTADLYVKADIDGGSSRNFQVTIQRPSDVRAMDTTYNTRIVVGLGVLGGTTPVPTSTTNEVTINAGNATVQVDQNSAVGDVPVGSTHVALATFDFNSTGEPVRIQSIPVIVTTLSGITGGSASDYFMNGELVDTTNPSAPVQIGSNMNLGVNTLGDGSVTTTFNIPGYWVLPSGTTRQLTVYADTKADIATSTQLNNGVGSVGLGTVSGQGENSLQTVTLTSGVTGRDITLTTSSLTASTNSSLAAGSSSNITGVPTQTNARIASFVLTAGPAEAVNVTQIELQTSAVAASDFQNLRVTTSSPGATYTTGTVTGTAVGNTQGAIIQNTLYTFSPSTSLQIPAGSSIVVDVYADLLGGATTGSTQATVNLYGVTATGNTDNQGITATGVPTTGQVAYIGTAGALTVAMDSQAPTASQLQQEVMGSTGQTVGVYSLAASTAEPITVTQLTVTDTETSGAEGDFQNFQLFENGSQVANTPTVQSESGTGTTGTIVFNMQGTPLVIPAGQTVDLYLKASVTAYPNAHSGDEHNFNLASGAVVGRGAYSGAATATSAVVAGVNAFVYKTALTVATDSSFTGGSKSPSAITTVGVFDISNATNAASQQATLWPSGTSGNSISFTINSNLPVTASTTRIFTVYKSTDLVDPVLQATLTPTITSGTPSWNGTLTFNASAGTASFTPVGTFTATATAVTTLPVVVNAGQTQSLTAEFDTTDATNSNTNYNFTLTIPTQGSNKVWYDGSAYVSTLNGLPLTLPTIQP